MKGKRLADDIRKLAKEMNIDLSKADEKKTTRSISERKRYLR